VWIVNIEDRVERLNTMIREDRITRNVWSKVDEQGREVACLLAALSPEAGDARLADACPASVMPVWFAHLTPWIDDKGSTAEWPRTVRRYAACAARWSVLDEAAWRRVEVAARRASVVEAMGHTTDERVLDACRGVLVWLDDDMPESSRAAAMEAAGWAGEAAEAAQAAAEAAEAAWAAWAAAAAWAALDAAETATAAWAWAAAAWAWSEAGAAQAAAESAQAGAEAAVAESARTAGWAAAGAAVAADRITDAVLTALEKECGLNQKEEA
jgi:hypothetical protein